MINHPQVCRICGKLWDCTCYRDKQNNDYLEYMRKLTEPKPAPAIDYDILAEKVAAKVVALMGKKKKRRAKR